MEIVFSPLALRGGLVGNLLESEGHVVRDIESHDTLR